MCISSPETDRKAISMGCVYRNLGVGWWGQEVGVLALSFILLCEVGRIKKQLSSFTKHQRLVTFVLFKPLIHLLSIYLAPVMC